MFTGIIEAVAPIQAIRFLEGNKLLDIKRPPHFDDSKIGSSIAVNGICLTVLELSAQSFTVQVMQETLSKSTAASWQTGDFVNLERALQLSDRLDGHWVMGHVDTKARFTRKELRKNTEYYHFEFPAADRKYLIPQGSIAIDGISLTIASLASASFSVALIIHTTDNTILPRLRPGQYVNLEYDALGKYALQRSL